MVKLTQTILGCRWLPRTRDFGCDVLGTLQCSRVAAARGLTASYLRKRVLGGRRWRSVPRLSVKQEKPFADSAASSP